MGPAARRQCWRLDVTGPMAVVGCAFNTSCELDVSSVLLDSFKLSLDMDRPFWNWLKLNYKLSCAFGLCFNRCSAIVKVRTSFNDVGRCEKCLIVISYVHRKIYLWFGMDQTFKIVSKVY